MCGFVGFIDELEENQKKDIVKKMADLIIHRGPDDENYYTDDKAALGFRRLSIIDLEGGAQPIFNEDRTKVLLYNGEIYNYMELREELINKGHIFSTKSDSEVIIHGYEEYGQEILGKLRGMFAFVIWDIEKAELFGARDIFGIKPFYYALPTEEKGSPFLFASEIKAFLGHPGFVKKVNMKRLPEYLSFEYIPNEETMFEGVYKLLAGHCFTYKDGKINISQYNEISYHIDNEKSLEEWVDEISKTFSGSVLAHRISDVEVGCFLSSGVDSSYVANEVSKSSSMKAFTVGYEEEKYSEISYAEEFAAAVGLDLHTKKVSAREMFDIVPLVQYHMDEPLPNPSALPLYFVANNAARHVKVVLSGEGADELFGGYNYYTEPLEFAKYQRLPLFLRKCISGAAKLLPNIHGKRFLIRGSQKIEERFIRNNYVFGEKERKKVLADPSLASTPTAKMTKPYFDKVKDLDDVTKMQYVDMHTWMLFDILLKADKMSMANSLELRVPFLDREMLNVALSLPSKYRVTMGSTKLALRRAAIRELPPKTANKKKMGFQTPLNDWLNTDLYYDHVRSVFESDNAAIFFDQKYILKLLEDHKKGKPSTMKKVWSVYCFLLWYDEYFVKR